MFYLLKIITGLTHYLILIATLVAVTGCTNYFAKHYKPLLSPINEPDLCESGEIQVYNLPQKNKEELYRDLLSLGYAPVGEASWLGPLNMGSSEALEQAENLGACLVMWRADYQPAMARMLYKYHSIFFIRIKPDPLGAVLYGAAGQLKGHLSIENQGCQVMGIFPDTPAHNAQIYKGDIITSVNGRPCQIDYHMFQHNQVYLLEIYRNGSILNKTVVIP